MSLRAEARWIVGLSVALLIGCAAPGPPEPAAWTVTVLAEGGPLHATNGMYFGPDGRLYVVSVSSATVAALDPESGAVLERWGPEEGVQGPDDLTFGPDGLVVLDRFRLWRRWEAHARRDDDRGGLTRPRRESDHVLG